MTATVRSADGRVVVDSRLRARRVTVRRSAGLRRLRRLGACAALVAVCAAAYGLTRSPLLAVKRVQVTGTEHVPASQIRQVAAVRKGMPMTDVGPSQVARRLAQIPWLATAKVQRDWPGNVKITVVERQAVAVVADGKVSQLVDGTGRVLGSVSSAPADLVALTGLRAPPAGQRIASAAMVMAAVRALPVRLRPTVSSIGPGPGTTVTVHLVGGAKVAMGGPGALREEFISLETMLSHLPGLTAACTVDVTVPDAPTLTPANGCA